MADQAREGVSLTAEGHALLKELRKRATELGVAAFPPDVREFARERLGDRSAFTHGMVAEVAFEIARLAMDVAAPGADAPEGGGAP